MIIRSTIERCILQTMGSEDHLLHHQTGLPILPAASASHILRDVSHLTEERILPASSVSCAAPHLLHALRVISLPQARPTDSSTHRLDWRVTESSSPPPDRLAYSSCYLSLQDLHLGDKASWKRQASLQLYVGLSGIYLLNDVSRICLKDRFLSPLFFSVMKPVPGKQP